jgi:membrane associated rhomboid family serine protease
VRRFERLNAPPYATYILIAVNVLVALWALAAAPGESARGTTDVQRDLGLFGPFIANGDWYRLITAGFTHSGLMHLVFNMLVVWQFGSLLEPALGRARFVALYFAALLAGSAGALVVEPDALTVGASGAAFGIVGAAAVGFQLRGVSIWNSGLGLMLGINLVITFAVPGISVGGHLGGLAGGALIGLAYFAPRDRITALPQSLSSAFLVASAAVFIASLAV